MDGFVRGGVLDESDLDERMSSQFDLPVPDDIAACIRDDEPPAWEEIEGIEPADELLPEDDATSAGAQETLLQGRKQADRLLVPAAPVGGNLNPATLGHSTDPVHLFLREMSRAEPLSREEEVVLAQRIEARQAGMPGRLVAQAARLRTIPGLARA